jgi:hypothetical protein
MSGNNRKRVQGFKKKSVGLLFGFSVVLLNSAASSEQIDPTTIKDENVKKGISGEWIKVLRKPGTHL